VILDWTDGEIFASDQGLLYDWPVFPYSLVGDIRIIDVSDVISGLADVVTVRIPMRVEVLDADAIAEAVAVGIPMAVLVMDIQGETDAATVRIPIGVVVVEGVSGADVAVIDFSVGNLVLYVVAVDGAPALDSVVAALRILVDAVEAGLTPAEAIRIFHGIIAVDVGDSVEISERRSVLHVVPIDLYFDDAALKVPRMSDQVLVE
jgi:hypothetical protein